MIQVVSMALDWSGLPKLVKCSPLKCLFTQVLWFSTRNCTLISFDRLISLWGWKETNIYVKSQSHVANSCSATVATPPPHLCLAVPSLLSCLNAGPSFQPPSNHWISGNSNVFSGFCKFVSESMFSPGVSLDHLKLCCLINVHFNVSPLFLTFCHMDYHLFF